MMLELLLASALIQDAPQEREKPRVRSEVNFRLHEWFEETREDGVTDAGHPYTLDLPLPNGAMTFNTYCHWLKREKKRPAAEEEDQEDETTPDRSLVPVPTPFPFRNGSAGGKIQFATSLGIPAFRVASPTDSIGVEFDEVDAEAMPGLFLSTTLAFGTFELLLFADYVAGNFGASRSVTFDTGGGGGGGGGGHGGGGGGGGGSTTSTDTFDLEGKLWMMQLAVAPILKRFATEDGLFSAEIAFAAGGYFGERTETVARRSGSVTESLPVEDESLFGFFAGPTVHTTLRIAGALRLGAFGEFWRLMGAVEGWTGLAGLEVRIEF